MLESNQAVRWGGSLRAIRAAAKGPGGRHIQLGTEASPRSLLHTRMGLLPARIRVAAQLLYEFDALLWNRFTRARGRCLAFLLHPSQII